MRITGSVGQIGCAGQLQQPRQRTSVFAEPERKFDQVVVRENSFQKQLVSKLSQEVRAAATTTGTVAALREQVGAGEYQVDPHAIARSLLFVWEA